ncbi:MAG: OmpA family protein [Tagaea sp.]
MGDYKSLVDLWISTVEALYFVCLKCLDPSDEQSRNAADRAFADLVDALPADPPVGDDAAKFDEKLYLDYIYESLNLLVSIAYKSVATRFSDRLAGYAAATKDETLRSGEVPPRELEARFDRIAIAIEARLPELSASDGKGFEALQGWISQRTPVINAIRHQFNFSFQLIGQAEEWALYRSDQTRRREEAESRRTSDTLSKRSYKVASFAIFLSGIQALIGGIQIYYADLQKNDKVPAQILAALRFSEPLDAQSPKDSPTLPRIAQDVVAIRSDIGRPASAPTPIREVRSYLIFFEFDSSALPHESAGVLREIVDQLRAFPDSRLDIAGHTDTSGPQIHNLQLSFRRAQSVAESLLASGVARERVYIRAVGESELRVRTGDGIMSLGVV